jgi:tRNA dimethylallyltransferase
METSEHSRPQVVVFLLGTTGVGKSKLALDLAERLNGEIVNADSMQIYSGNDGVMTAKPTPVERKRAPHHLYDVVDPLTTRDFNVNKYLSLALPTLSALHSQGKLPIVVGGTNYYIEGLLFDKVKECQVDWVGFEEAMRKA